jgi:hypothetical protein
MDVAFRCPHCHEPSRAELAENARGLGCAHCEARWPIAEGAIRDGNVTRCLLCPSTELFVRKDFSQSLGLAIVIAGIVLSSVFWAYRMPIWTYAVLFATALLDVILYFTVDNLLECYRCRAQYRGIAGLDTHETFNLETHEKHRQQRLRLPQDQKSEARNTKFETSTND